MQLPICYHIIIQSFTTHPLSYTSSSYLISEVWLQVHYKIIYKVKFINSQPYMQIPTFKPDKLCKLNLHFLSNNNLRMFVQSHL